MKIYLILFYFFLQSISLDLVGQQTFNSIYPRASISAIQNNDFDEIEIRVIQNLDSSSVRATKICYQIYSSKTNFEIRKPVDSSFFYGSPDSYDSEIGLYCYDITKEKRHKIKISKINSEILKEPFILNYLIMADEASFSKIVLNKIWLLEI